MKLAARLEETENCLKSRAIGECRVKAIPQPLHWPFLNGVGALQMKGKDVGNSVCNVYGPPAISRRHALGLAFGLMFGASGGTPLAIAQPRAEPCPHNVGTHNMMVVG